MGLILRQILGRILPSWEIHQRGSGFLSTRIDALVDRELVGGSVVGDDTTGAIYLSVKIVRAFKSFPSKVGRKRMEIARPFWIRFVPSSLHLK